jgi:glycosyltransferase involved in cell wall biosynthesis
VELSVVTVTHNRQALLERKLDSLLAQTLSPERFEWLLCVNGSSDGTLAFFQTLRLPFQLKLVVYEKQASPAVARNACARQARGRALYFSDDDCLLAPETLAAHARAQRVPCVAIGGIDFEAGDESYRWEPRRVNYWNVNGANTSVDRRAFEAVGGFDECLEGYGGEDVLLGYMLGRYGLAFRALAGARVRHLGPEPTRAGDEEKARSAGRNAVRIARRHPELAFRLGVHPVLLSLKQLVCSPLLTPLTRRLSPATFRYEHAYLLGALEERDHGRQ